MLSEIQSRKFGDETGEFLLELSLGNIMTIFETDLQVSNGGPPKSGKFESASFNFGSFDWNVSIVVHNYGANSGNATNVSASSNGDNGDGPAGGRIIYVFLNRLSGFDHPCRVQYRVVIGEGANREDSSVLDQISDAGGRIRGFQMQHSLTDLMKPNGTVRIFVELHCCNAISEAKVPIVRNPSPTINCYDRNKQVNIFFLLQIYRSLYNVIKLFIFLSLQFVLVTCRDGASKQTWIVNFCALNYFLWICILFHEII